MSKVPEIIILTPDQYKSDIIEAIESAVRKALENQSGVKKILEDQSEEPEIMTRAQVAKYCKVSPGTIIKQVKKCGFPENRKFGFPRYIKSEVDDWLKN